MLLQNNWSINIFWGDSTEFGQGAAQVCHSAHFGDHRPILPNEEKKHFQCASLIIFIFILKKSLLRLINSRCI